VGLHRTKALWHPTRLNLIGRLRRGPARRSRLVEDLQAPFAEVSYHCRALCECDIFRYVEGSGPTAADPMFELNRDSA